MTTPYKRVLVAPYKPFFGRACHVKDPRASHYTLRLARVAVVSLLPRTQKFKQKVITARVPCPRSHVINLTRNGHVSFTTSGEAGAVQAPVRAADWPQR
eukprot:1136123-Pelagomonas_calceolata.AAC.6